MNFLPVLVILVINVGLDLCAPVENGDTEILREEEEMIGELLQSEKTDATEYATRKRDFSRTSWLIRRRRNDF